MHSTRAPSPHQVFGVRGHRNQHMVNKQHRVRVKGELLEKASRTMTWKPRPESGFDCRICATFARHRDLQSRESDLSVYPVFSVVPAGRQHMNQRWECCATPVASKHALLTYFRYIPERVRVLCLFRRACGEPAHESALGHL